MVRRIDLIPSAIKLLLAVIYDLFSLAVAFYFAYIIRLGIENIEFSLHENIAFVAVALSLIHI